MSEERGGPERRRLTVAQKLDHLLKMRAGPSENGKPSYKKLAAEIAAQSGETFSSVYLWQLHRGERTNPTLRHLCAMAAYFDVPVSYFTEDDVARRMIDEEVLAGRELDQAMAEAGVSAVYLRGDLAALSPEGKRMAADMIRQLRELEQGTRRS
ncbi:XRE family transcriptional regulator [Streptomyces roseoverticillatus]|uniref:XRE family transcriptional regulator n=1 Tax=Streptomyces roseoverticillatus TaxID=66429 RepID=UPI001F1FBD2C|nr:XRE family transcriptional regulator [Streptomyces roseoverticillatus]MCF3101905.1 XRE family transcriptional regulator [Streptomyces roseoverticillatus]